MDVKQIEKLAADPKVLATFENLVNAKLEVWKTAQEFEYLAGDNYEIEAGLSNFCVGVSDPYEAKHEDLRRFLTCLTKD